MLRVQCTVHMYGFLLHYRVRFFYEHSMYVYALGHVIGKVKLRVPLGELDKIELECKLT